MRRRRLSMERRQRSPVHVRHSRLLAAAFLVYESSIVLQKWEYVSVGVLRQARTAELRHLAREWKPKQHWPGRFNVSILVRSTEHNRTVPVFLHLLRNLGATAALCRQTTKASSHSIIHCQSASGVLRTVLNPHPCLEVRSWRHRIRTVRSGRWHFGYSV